MSIIAENSNSHLSLEASRLSDVAVLDDTEGSESSLIWFLERNLCDENKFLRAWSYNGFHELARQHREYIDYAIEQIERGEADKAASVKARIRNIRKAMNKLPTMN